MKGMKALFIAMFIQPEGPASCKVNASTDDYMTLPTLSLPLSALPVYGQEVSLPFNFFYKMKLISSSFLNILVNEFEVDWKQ